ncbi:37S ribosomal protein S8, mitochondrial [Golovinomyces cichoracearum]|uniref:Small ribosomal subunit protein uS8m n=1 Tax=Golovinomyces cichoracearum TaxID=62708 RepID=A0A420IZY8_9PEZI|nr:37S ribosomal protein S8, mitochondrial [Golovinomyces cichoracearum]RKF80101.1 37S ribosomal protein S8, mitochondrial [Golovinomyces cichoracearum]
MSLVHLSHMCSHLQNASMVRLGMTSVPSSNQILSVSLALQAAGFISSVTRGGLIPPPVHELSSYEPEPVTQENISTRRLWLGLKYWNNQPVLRHMSMISRPTKRIWMNVDGLGQIARGNRYGEVAGMTRTGECIFVSTDKGIKEVRECVQRRIGGMLLCRVV